jgi:rare lipoprotein A
MHKKHGISIGGLLLAASFLLPASVNGLQASEVARLDPVTGQNAVKAMSGDSGNQSEPMPGKDSAGKGQFLIAEGKASYYANRFNGRRTASGEHFDRRDYTAAHRSLPFGTRLRVTNLANGRHVVVKVNDRGPHLRGRIIDISQAAARQIGLVENGVGNVRIEACN